VTTTDDTDARLKKLALHYLAEHLDDLVAWEREGIEVSKGDALVHGDLRDDNLLLVGERLMIVDWPHASRGAAWLDLAMFLPSVVMQGVVDVCEPVTVSADPGRRARGGAWAASTFAAHPLGSDVHPADLRSVVAGIAGYFLHSAR
jgi:aminoglycoside phosphotransferase (APT) family kinase protein